MATSRLKRKLEINDTRGYGNVLESFVAYGTALPSLADKKDSNEFKPVWEQTVTDSEGRRRFHGAFTGGFSAGYYNTVGSKEGWTPATFVSSRGDKGRDKGKKTTLLDEAKAFMDDEDLAELQADRKLTTNDQYHNAAPQQQQYDPLMGLISGQPQSSVDPLVSLIQPSSSKIGTQLMRSMGWKEGQGIGPQVTYAKRREQAKKYGIYIGDDLNDDQARQHMYAPLDRPAMTISRDNTFYDKGRGLGYTPGASLNEAKDEDPKAVGTNNSFGGLDYGEDDVTYDPYATSRDDDLAALSSALKSRITETSVSKTARRNPDVKKQRDPSASVFHDGTKAPPGFSVVAENSLIHPISRLPSPPPDDWKPNPSRILGESVDSLSSGRKNLSHGERGKLLGEKELPRSVFDYLSSKDKERLERIKQEAASGRKSALPLERTRAPILFIDQVTATAALKGFQPYATVDPEKHKRYTTYLLFHAGKLGPVNQLPLQPIPQKQTTQDFEFELNEYKKSALVFKPVSHILSGRFTTASSTVVPGDAAATPGLYKPDPSKRKPMPEPEPEREKEVVLQDSDMFGPLTHSVLTFRPVHLLCKRFGVRDPYVKDSADLPLRQPGEVSQDAEQESRADFLEKLTDDILNSTENDKAQTSTTVKSGIGLQPPPLEAVGLGDDPTQGATTLEYERPSIDVFAAIFGDDDAVNEPEEGQTAQPEERPAVDTEDTIVTVDTLDQFTPVFTKADPGIASKKKPKTKKRKHNTSKLSFAFEDGDAPPVTSKKPKAIVSSNTVSPQIETVKSDNSRSKPGRQKASEFY